MIIFTPNTIIKSADMNTNFAEILTIIYPVGSIYTSTVSTNPNTLFGFGTWVAFGAGRVLVGKATSGTFATAGGTGGAETHTLTVAEMPSHSHTWSQTQADPFVRNRAPGAGAIVYPGNGGNWDYAYATGTNSNTGGGGAHNNLQPYVVVYMWQRTA